MKNLMIKRHLKYWWENKWMVREKTENGNYYFYTQRWRSWLFGSITSIAHFISEKHACQYICNPLLMLEGGKLIKIMKPINIKTIYPKKPKLRKDGKPVTWSSTPITIMTWDFNK